MAWLKNPFKKDDKEENKEEKGKEEVSWENVEMKNEGKWDMNWLYKKKEKKWNELNHPIGYIVGVTPGFATISKSPETFKDLGLARKYLKGALYGFEFIQLDFETISEINERYLKEMIKDIKKYQNLEIGLHAPVVREAAVDLGVAFAQKWILHHRNVQRSAYACGEILGAKYFLFHSSSNPRPNIAIGVGGEGRYSYMREELVSFTGMNLGRWVKQLDGEIKTIFEGKKYDNFVDPCYRKKFKPLNGFRFKEYVKARFISTLYSATGVAADSDLVYYLYYFDSMEDAMNRAKERRKKLYKKMIEDVIEDVKDRVEKLIEDIEEGIDKMEEELEEEEDKYRRSQLKSQIEQLKKQKKEIEKGWEEYEDLIEGKEDLEEINTLYPKSKDKYIRYQNLSNALSRAGYIPGSNYIHEYISSEIRRKYHDFLDDPKNKNTKEYRAIKFLANIEGRGMDLDNLFEYWAEVKGSEGTEDVAYLITAKYMYLSEDYLWKEIVGLRYQTGIDDAYDPDDVVLAVNRGFKSMKDFFEHEDPSVEVPFKERLNKYSSEFKDFIYNKEERTPLQIAEDIVTAVAAKYIQGHLFVKDEWAMDTLPEWLNKIGAFTTGEVVEFNNESIYDYAERGGTYKQPIVMFIETEQPQSDEVAGRLRIIRGVHHIILIKSIIEHANSVISGGGEDIIPRDKGPYKDIFAYTVDFEHLSTNLVDPIEDAKALKDGDAKYIKMLHINAPRPYGGQHGPLFLLSEDMYILYEWAYTLRQKGMHNAYFIWEMGSYNIYQSSLIFRRMAMALEQGIPPKELPPEFYGIDETILAEQKLTLIHHAYDPLAGMLLHPEETHTFLGAAAKEKGKLQEWKGEEYR